jgi:hypothetical protein
MMNSTSLEHWQVERLFKRVQQELHFLDRLEGRMHQKHFPADDLVFDRVKKAREAVKELSIQLSHLMEPQ